MTFKVVESTTIPDGTHIVSYWDKREGSIYREGTKSLTLGFDIKFTLQLESMDELYQFIEFLEQDNMYTVVYDTQTTTDYGQHIHLNLNLPNGVLTSCASVRSENGFGIGSTSTPIPDLNKFLSIFEICSTSSYICQSSSPVISTNEPVFSMSSLFDFTIYD